MANRNLTAGLLTEVTSSSLSPVALIDLEFTSGAIRFWTGLGEITFNSNIYTGAGNLLGIDSIEETFKTKAAGVNISLTGVPASFISLALNEDYQGRPVKIYLGALSQSTGLLIADPFLIFQGFMDTMDMVESGDSADFTLSVENKLIALERANNHYWTAERQKVDFPDDKGFDLVTELQDKEVRWE